MCTRKKISIFFVLSMVVTCCLIVADHIVDKSETKESFIIKKNSKKRSKSKMQEELFKILGEQLSCAVKTHKIMAKIQEIQIEQTKEYLENSHKGFITKANHDSLNSCTEISKKFSDDMQKFLESCNTYLGHLRSL